MTLTKPQRAVLAEMVRTGLPLTYHGGVCRVGERETTVALRRVLDMAGMVAFQNPAVAMREEYREPRVLTDAGRAEGQKALASEHAPRCPAQSGATCRCGVTTDRPIAVHAADCDIVRAGYARGVCCSCTATDAHGDHVAPEACKGGGERVPHYEVRGGRAACPACGIVVPVLDDRDGSVFTVASHTEPVR